MAIPAPPAGTPRAEIDIDEPLARALLVSQHPDLADLPLTPVASGWDNVVFRLGAEMAMRLPRRAVAAGLIDHEQRWLPLLAPLLPIAVPAPLRIGRPQGRFPWAWSVVAWIEGETADLSAPDASEGERLGAFFEALHRPAPAEAPRNPYRGVPLAARLDAFVQRRSALAERGWTLDEAILAIWRDALAAPDDAASTWIQGDPHPRNVLVREGRIVGIIDWGDMAQGDRASDLAGVWMILPQAASRRLAMAACASVSAATWRRARGWAALYALMLLAAGLADDPRMAAIGAATLERLIEGP